MNFSKKIFKLLLILITIPSLYGNILILHSSKTGDIKPSNIKYLEKIKIIASSIGVSVSFKGVPWKRALLMVKKGKAQGVINASYKKDRAQFAVYPTTKSKELDGTRRLNAGKSYYIYKSINSTISWDGKYFKNPDAPVGAEVNFAVIEDLNKHTNIKIETMSSKISLLRAVYTNKLSAYAGVSVDIDKILKEHPVLNKKIVKEKFPIRKKDYFLIFSKHFYKSNEDIVEKIWDGLKE